jgi:exodeoxyribonuclease VII small subunit
VPRLWWPIQPYEVALPEVVLFSPAGVCLISNSPMSSKSKQPGEPLNFESAMDRLEAIVEQMESGKLALEDLIIRYEEGMSLVKTCQERLASAEQKIEIIARNSAGKPVVKNFEPAAETKTDNQVKPDQKGEQANEVRLF